MTDGFVDEGGLRLHYEEWGSRDAAGTVVLVHGLGSSSTRNLEQGTFEHRRIGGRADRVRGLSACDA